LLSEVRKWVMSPLLQTTGQREVSEIEVANWLASSL